MKGRIALNAVVGLVVIAAVSANAGSHRPPGSPPPTEGDGSYLVGRDIRPGTYRTTGNTDGRCHWERTRDASGGPGALLAHATVTGTGYVTVKATDGLFTSSGCRDWEAVGTMKATGSPGAPPGSRIDGDGGMYRVGVDIAPGTYRSAGTTAGRCRWERDRDALHTFGSVLAHGDATGSAVVTINADDAYFATSGCRDWTKAS
jgi:hypothetical protein